MSLSPPLQPCRGAPVCLTHRSGHPNLPHVQPFIARGEGADVMRNLSPLLCSLGEDRLPSWLVLFAEGTWVGGPVRCFDSTDGLFIRPVLT
jgi:hypothetical protein